MLKRLLRSAGLVCGLALIAVGAHAATNFVGPIQTYACASHTWANSLASSTGATICTQPAIADITGLASVAGGTVIGNNTASAGAAAATATPVLGVTSGGGTPATGTLGFNNLGAAGTVTIQQIAAASNYNFNLPSTAGSAGQVLTSQGGGSSAMTWSSLATAACSVTTNPASPVTLASAGDGTCYQITNSTPVTFNLTASLVAGDNWCFFQESTGAVTVADNSVTSAQIFMANVGGTVTTGTLVSQGAGSVACVSVVIGGANPIVITKNSEGAWQLT